MMRFWVHVIWCFGYITVHAQTVSPFDFLRTAESARAAALGGAFVAIEHDPSTQLYNPATLPTVAEHSVSLTFIKHVLDINSGIATYAGTIGSGWWGASAVFTSFGSFTRTDAFGNTQGTFGASHVAFTMSYANQLDTAVFYGIGIGYAQTSIERASGSALTLSGGILYELPRVRTTVGASVRFWGLQLSRLNGQDASLPTDVRIGVSHRLRGLPLLINVALTRLVEQRQTFAERLSNFAIGGEFYFGTNVQVRIGYDNAVRSSQSSVTASFFTGFGLGVGIVLPSISIDYALTTLSTPALVHRISCALSLKQLFDQPQ